MPNDDTQRERDRGENPPHHPRRFAPDHREDRGHDDERRHLEEQLEEDDQERPGERDPPFLEHEKPRRLDAAARRRDRRRKITAQHGARRDAERRGHTSRRGTEGDLEDAAEDLKPDPGEQHEVGRPRQPQWSPFLRPRRPDHIHRHTNGGGEGEQGEEPACHGNGGKAGLETLRPTGKTTGLLDR
jgi:hypothetical protein